MPNPIKESDQNALPDPELNPLLNPLLAAHMGRWAEVYFTTPPERRGQAIAELLRELESTTPAQSDSQVIVDEASREMEAESVGAAEALRDTERETTQAPATPPDAVESVCICASCGHSNREEQRFCGMCGTPLETPPERRLTEIDEFQPSARARADDPLPPFDTGSIDHATEPDERFTPPAEQHEAMQPAWPQARNQATNDLPHFRSETPRSAQHVPQYVPHFADDAPRAERGGVPYRYRLYVGVGLAVLLATLIYMARRGTGALSDAAQSPPARVIPSAQPAPVASEPAAATSGSAGGGKTVENTQRPLKPKVRSPRAASSEKQPAAASPAARALPISGSSAGPSAEPGGAEDLATAEKYLNGNQGRTRDSQEAVQLLWKAVGKGNPAATMVLSDLYLRGDGVPKSCDQARLLLDAAARKGVKSAAERLRNLQAFGCQ